MLVLGGGLTLQLPAMNTEGKCLNLTDAIFTSASAVSATGLGSENTGTFFNIKGQAFILFLIQTGGLGILLFAGFFVSLYKSRLSILKRHPLQQLFNRNSLRWGKRLVFYVLLIECIGAFGLYVLWNTHSFHSTSEQIFHAFFHAISAFCNAGFSSFPGNLTQTGISLNYFSHLVIIALIFFGALGFAAIYDIFDPANIRERIRHPLKKWNLNTRISFHTSIILVAIGAITFYLIEQHNTLKEMNAFGAATTSVLQSVTTRTAGLHSIDIATLKAPTLMVFILLMFIGASVGSTGGGVKTISFAVLMKAALQRISGKKVTTLGNRIVPRHTISMVTKLVVFSLIYITVSVIILSITDPHFKLLQIVFETVSAYCNVGLSTGITSGLSIPGKWLLIISMLAGRTGILVFIFSAMKAGNIKHTALMTG